jgi:hypothetical protein
MFDQARKQPRVLERLREMWHIDSTGPIPARCARLSARG